VLFAVWRITLMARLNRQLGGAVASGARLAEIADDPPGSDHPGEPNQRRTLARLGADPVWQRVVALAAQIATTDYPVLLLGEAGSGRTALARAIHAASGRRDGPLVELDLSIYHPGAQAVALAGEDERSGAWAQASGGTLILRGISSDLGDQSALIGRLVSLVSRPGPRLLIIATTERSISHDLRIRIPAQLRVPALRERPGDILLLARYLADRRAISSAAAELLESYAWPGNMTELRGVITRAMQLAGDGPIDVPHLPRQLLATAHAAQAFAPNRNTTTSLEQVGQNGTRRALDYTS
jgi:DNA-binding NtrC family response regulator